MVTIKKIVCALDLSDLCSRVVEYAVTMAKTFGADITVVYVTPSLHQYTALEIQPKAIEMFVGELSAGAEKNMEKAMEEHFAGVKAEARVVPGNPAEEIINTAESVNADLIVMGTHGRKGVKLIVFGSVAEKVVKNSKIPVLTVHPNQ